MCVLLRAVLFGPNFGMDLHPANRNLKMTAETITWQQFTMYCYNLGSRHQTVIDHNQANGQLVGKHQRPGAENLKNSTE